jgi:hypothetical protein
MAIAQVAFKVDWHESWPRPPVGFEGVIFPGDEFPDDHPVVSAYPGYFGRWPRPKGARRARRTARAS